MLLSPADADSYTHHLRWISSRAWKCVDFILFVGVLIQSRDDAEAFLLVKIHSRITVSFPSGVRPYIYGGREPDRLGYSVLGR